MVHSILQVLHRTIQLAGEQITRILGRWSHAWCEVLASALGAALAWVMAERLLGHHQPIFAPISAIICLSPGLPSHTRQTIGLLIGVATGIVIGELALVLPDGMPLMRLAWQHSWRCSGCFLWTCCCADPSGRFGASRRDFWNGHDRLRADGRVAIGAVVGLVFSYILRAPGQIQGAKAN
jgi:Fusaric acid resistance protein-like